jgi:hypothetical protein
VCARSEPTGYVNLSKDLNGRTIGPIVQGNSLRQFPCPISRDVGNEKTERENEMQIRLNVKVLVFGLLVSSICGCGGESAAEKTANDKAYVQQRVQQMIDGVSEDPKIPDDFPEGSKIVSLVVKEKSGDVWPFEAVIALPDGKKVTVYGEFNGDRTLPIALTYKMNAEDDAQEPKAAEPTVPSEP